MKLIILGLLCAIPLFAQPPYTLISDTLANAANGITFQPVTGTITSSITTFTYGVYTVAQFSQPYSVSNGVVSIPLVPTDHSGGCPSACPTYKVTTTVTPPATAPWNTGTPVPMPATTTTYWSVPTLPSSQCASHSFCTVKEVTIAYPPASTTLINVSQINFSSYSNGAYCFQVTSGAGTLTSSGCQSYSISMIFGGTGSTLTAPQVKYVPSFGACTIQGWNATTDSGTVQFDVWKVNLGISIFLPNSSNSIVASAYPAVVAGNLVSSTLLTGWSTAVAANDFFGIQLKSITGSPTQASLVLLCH